MNYFDHIYRELELIAQAASTTTTTLSAGTAETLYPITNLSNGRPGIPFRVVPDGSDQVVIEIDLGSIIDIANIYLVATSCERITSNALLLEGGETGALSDYSGYADLFGANDSEADFRGYTFLYPVTWAVDDELRYLEFTLTQSNLAESYLQIGELWIEQTGDNSWFDDSAIDKDLDAVVYSSNSNVINFTKNARGRGMRVNKESTLRSDRDGISTMIEETNRECNLVHVGGGYFGQQRGLSWNQLRDDDSGNFEVSKGEDFVWQTFRGDGRVE